jgi:hypothetical protein
VNFQEFLTLYAKEIAPVTQKTVLEKRSQMLAVFSTKNLRE